METNINSQREPELEPPGAGLPFPDRLMIRAFMPFVARFSNWDQNFARFDALNGRILTVIDNVPEDLLLQKILVPKQRGLEDSSRFWSIAMTLEHLVTVGENQIKIIEALANTIKPQIVVRIENVKPKGGCGGKQQVEEFQKFSETVQQRLASEKFKVLGSKTTLVHPWFGPFNAKQWQWLFHAHTAIHLEQIKQIVKQL